MANLMRSEILRQPTAQKLLIWGFFAAVFLAFTRPLWLVSDFWWHLNAGRWLWEHGQLPTVDPFLFSSATELGLRQELILQGYWLAQLLYFQIWQLSGLFGIVLFKAATLTLIFWLIWRHLRRQGVELVFTLFLAGALVLLSPWFAEARPQVFSFLGAVVVLLLLERSSSDSGDKGVSKLFWLPLVMALWANLHPGFIVGLALIGAYALRQVVETAALGRLTRPAGQRLLLYLAGMGAVLLNPAGASALQVIWSGDLGWAAEITRRNNEYDTLWNFYRQVDEPLLLGLYAFVTLLLFLALFQNWRRQQLFTLLMLLGLLGFSLSSFRYSLFFVLLAPLLLAGQLRTLAEHASLHLRRFWVLGLTLSLLVCANEARSSVLFGAEPHDAKAFAEIAARIERLPAGSRVVNPYEWGGYLAWRTARQQTFFMDARAFDERVFSDYLQLAFEGDATILDKYAADCLVFNLEPDRIPEIVLKLLASTDWQVDYLEERKILFTRSNDNRTGTAAVNRTAVERLLARYALRLPEGGEPVLVHKTLGRLFLLRGENATARRHFQAAAEIRPDDDDSRRWLETLTPPHSS